MKVGTLPIHCIYIKKKYYYYFEKILIYKPKLILYYDRYACGLRSENGQFPSIFEISCDTYLRFGSL
jgi:hypothetical protein